MAPRRPSRRASPLRPGGGWTGDFGGWNEKVLLGAVDYDLSISTLRGVGVRIRTIKPEFWESETLSRVSRDARLLFVGLFSSCDDSGRTRASSRLLASRLFPYDEDAGSLLDGWLSELEDAGCIRRYCVGGESFLDIPKWLSHQKIDKPSPSKIPEFVEDSRGVEKNSLGTGNREQGTGRGVAKDAPEVQKLSSEKSLLRESAERVLSTLNLACGRSYRAVDSTLQPIMARLQEVDVTEEGVIEMVKRQCLRWKPDPKMREFLRPETLFAKSKFDGYYAARGEAVDPVSGSTFTPVGQPVQQDWKKMTEKEMVDFAQS